MTKNKLISGILSIAIMLSVIPVGYAATDTPKADTSLINAYVDEKGQIITNNMKVYMGDNGYNKLADKGGQLGWLFDVSVNNTDYYLYMDVDDKLADKTDMGRIINVTVEYFDQVDINIEKKDQLAGCLTIEYTNSDGKVIEAPYVDFQNSLTWKKHTFVLKDAMLLNGVNGADFRVCSKSTRMATSGDNFVVKMVDVELTDKFAHVTITPQTANYGNNFFTGQDILFNYTFDNRKYATYSHMKGEYPLDVKFIAKSYEGEVMFEKEDNITLKPGVDYKYDLEIDVGERYGVYFLTTIVSNEDVGVYNDNTTRFSYIRTDYGKTMNYEFGVCAGRRDEWEPLYQNAGIGLMRSMVSYSNVTNHDMGAKDAYFYPVTAYSLQRDSKNRNVKQFNGYLSVKKEVLPGEHAPHTEAGMQKVMDYMNYITEAEKGGIVSYDMWNEWELYGASFNIHSRPFEDYIEYMKKTYTEMKPKYPDLKLYGVVTSEVKPDFLKRVLDAGGGDYMDGYCCHAYQPRYNPMTGGGLDKIWQTRKLLDEYGYTEMPIVTSELGFVDDTHFEIDDLIQGYWLCYFYIALQKIPHFDQYVMYQFYDGGRTRGNREHHWGLIEFTGSDTPGTAKASYAMVSNMNLMLANYEYVDEIETGNNTYVYRMYNEEKDDDVVVIWGINDGGTISVDFGTDKLEAYDEYGNMREIYGVNGVFSFPVTEAVMYLKGDFNKFEKAENIFMEQTRFSVEFESDVDFKINNHTGKKLNVEFIPRHNNDMKFTVTENEDLSLNVHVDNARTVAEKDVVRIRISDDEKLYVDGNMVFRHTVPLAVDLNCKPVMDENGKVEYDSIILLIDVINNATVPLKGKILINSIEGISDYANSYDVDIPSGEKQTIEIKSKTTANVYYLDAAFVSDNGTSRNFTNNTSFAVCNYAETKPVIDGIVSEGEYKDTIYLGSQHVVDIHAVDPYTGDSDFSANVSYAWDEENFYIAMECIDNTLYDKTAAIDSMWRYDSFQLAGVYDPENKYEDSVLTSVVFGKTNDIPTLAMVKNAALKTMADEDSGFEGKINRTGTSTIYEVKVPWKTLLVEEMEVLPDTIFKFAALANDNDGGGRKAAVEYGTGIYSGGTSTSGFLKMYLVK